jgi:Heavy metal associated domain 2
MSTQLPVAFVSHSVPGRVRLRIPTMRHQDEYFARLRDKLTTVPGLKRLTTNTRTASVLLEYTGEIEPIEALGTRLGIFELGTRPHPHSLSEWLHTFTSAPDDLVKQLSDGRLDMAGVTALVLTGFGISQIVRGHALPAGWTLLWNATNLVRDVGGKGDRGASK